MKTIQRAKQQARPVPVLKMENSVALLEGCRLKEWVCRATNKEFFYGVSRYDQGDDTQDCMDIIEQFRISVRQYTDERYGPIIIACIEGKKSPVAGVELPQHAGWWHGRTVGEAVMRCVVASVYGLEVPEGGG